jgi:hypothetical protein
MIPTCWLSANHAKIARVAARGGRADRSREKAGFDGSLTKPIFNGIDVLNNLLAHEHKIKFSGSVECPRG